MHKLLFGDDHDIKHERDSADLTMSRIPVSSRGTDAGLSGIGEESKRQLHAGDGEHHDSKESPISDIVVSKIKTMKRQMTMKPEDEQQDGGLEMPDQADQDDRISLPGAKKRINSDFIEP